MPSPENDAPAEVRIDLCHKGNYENVIGQPDVFRVPTPDPLPNLAWFVCPTEANGINRFPCTGSRHIDHRTSVVCTCACHQRNTVVSPERPCRECNGTGTFEGDRLDDDGEVVECNVSGLICEHCAGTGVEHDG